MGLFDFIKRLFNPDPPQPRPRPSGQTPSNPLSGRPTPAPAAPPSPSPARGQQPQPAKPTPPPPRTLNLDAAQFAPIESGAAIRQARSLRSVGWSAWWGRRNTIPPVSDERTLLIDRSMVAYGLLKPEELVEIHQIGDQMLAYRGDQSLAEGLAREAIAENEAERKRFKEQKRAESAERKRQHAEDVARRKATDIIFLGRGVSRGLADRRANVEKLQAAGLPLLASPADVAHALGLSIPRLRWLAFHSDAVERLHYIRFSVPKKSGGVRELSAPHRDLAAAQRWIFQNILVKLPSHAAAHGFVRGRSIRTNALPHVGRQRLVNADLKDFFPTITFHRVRGAFEQLGYSPAAATVLALLCTEAPRRTVEYAGRTFHVATGPRALPQGACTSPALSNLISRRLDSRLQGIATKLGWRYTRYADDLTFSADEAAAAEKTTGYLLARLRHIAQDEGFVVNEKKTRVFKRSAAMAVTGIVVNERPNVRRREVRRLRAILHHARRSGLAAQNRAGHEHFAAQVRGRIAFVKMVNPEQGQRLMAAFEALAR